LQLLARLLDTEFGPKPVQNGPAAGLLFSGDRNEATHGRLDRNPYRIVWLCDWKVFQKKN